MNEKLSMLSSEIMESRMEVARMGLESENAAIVNTFLNLSSLYLKKAVKVIDNKHE